MIALYNYNTVVIINMYNNNLIYYSLKCLINVNYSIIIRNYKNFKILLYKVSYIIKI